MADQKISELTALTGTNLADVDAFAVVDTSAVQTKKITYAELKAALDTGTGFVRITGDTMTGNLIVDAGSWSTVVSGNAITFDRNGENNIIADNGTSANLNLTAGNRIFYSADDYQSFKIGSSPTEKLRILSTGINVTGTVTVGNSSIGSNTSHLANLTINNNSYIGSANATNAIQIATSGNVTFKSPDLNITADNARLMIEEADGTDIVWLGDHTGSGHGGLLLYNHGGNATVKLTADSHANYINNGNNFGVGTAGPSSYDNYANNLVVYEAGHGGITIATGTSNHGSLYFADGTSGNTAYRGYLDYDHADDSLDIGTGGTHSVTIDSFSNVGIGTSTIANESDHNKLKIAGGSGTGAGIIEFADTSNNIDGAIFADGGNLFIVADRDGATADSSIRFRVDGSSEKMRIDSSGRVGINRTPSISNSKLEVGGADNVSIINVEASGVTGGMGIGSTGLQLFHGSSSKMRINSSGKIQIGNNIPMWSGSYGGALFLKGNNATADRYAQLTIVNSSGVATTSGLKINNDGSATFGGSVTATGGTIQSDTATLRIQSNTTATKGVSLGYNHSSSTATLLADHQGVNQLDMNYYALSHTFGRSSSSEFLTIDSSGNSTFSNAVNITASLNPALNVDSSQAGMLVPLGGSAQTNYTDLQLFSNGGSGEIFKAGTGYTSWGGSKALNIFNSDGIIAFHPSSTENIFQISNSFVNSNRPIGIGTSAPVTRLDVVSSGNSSMLIHTDLDGGLASLMFKTDSQNLSTRMKGAVIFARDDPGTRGTGSLHLCVNGVNSDVNAGVADAKLSISAAGNVGIGTTESDALLHLKGGNEVAKIKFEVGTADADKFKIYASTSGRLYVNSYSGNTGVYLNYNGTSWSSNSDETLKDNITSLGTVGDKLKNYRTSYFNWKADTDTPPKRNIGFIAQDWETDFPEVVTKKEGETLGMQYTETIPILLKYIQELEARITALEA